MVQPEPDILAVRRHGECESHQQCERGASQARGAWLWSHLSRLIEKTSSLTHLNFLPSSIVNCDAGYNA